MSAGIMQFLPLLMGMMQGMGGGENGEFKSTYGEGAQGLLSDIQQSIKGMKGSQDITQNQNYQQGENWLQGLFNDPQFFQQFEAPLQRQFQEQTVPDLANRFASMGSGGSTGSTGFRNQLAREGSNLSTNIAALRGGMQQQGVNQGLQYAQQPMQNLLQLMGLGMTPTNNVYQPPTPGLWGNLISGMSGGFAHGYGQQAGQNFAGQSPSTTPSFKSGSISF